MARIGKYSQKKTPSRPSRAKGSAQAATQAHQDALEAEEPYDPEGERDRMPLDRRNAWGKYSCFSDCPWKRRGRDGFTKRGDLLRHVHSRHWQEKPHQCPHCGNTYAQKISLKQHYQAHHSELEEDRNAYRCPFAACKNKRFSDASSRARHCTEQHSRTTYQCPECTARGGAPRRIKRCSGYKAHLMKKHGYTDEAVAQAVLIHKVKILASPAKAAPSKKKSARAKERTPEPEETPSTVQEEYPDIAPPYSPTPYAGEIPLICTPDDGYVGTPISDVSTPGLSFSSPSPSPSIPELVCYPTADSLAPPPSIEGCKDNNDPYGFPTHGDMSGFSVDATAGLNLILSDSYLYDAPCEAIFDALSFGNMMSSYPRTDVPEPQPQQNTLHDSEPFFPVPYSNLSQLNPFSAPEFTGYGQIDEYSQWGMLAPEQAYVSQASMIIPPSLPDFMPSQFGSYYPSQ